MARGRSRKEPSKQVNVERMAEMKLPAAELIRHKKGDAKAVAEDLAKALGEQSKAYEQLGLSVRRLSISEHQKKLTGMTSHSPYIGQFAHSTTVPSGGNTSLTVWVTNPDPFQYFSGRVIGHVFFGPGNIIGDTAQALLAADVRFPRFGRTGALPASSTSTWQYTLSIPAVDRGVHVVNLFLFKVNAFDPGQYLDRIAYDLNVT